MRRTLRAAIVGTGYAGRRHVEALRALPGVEIAALAASSPERADEAASAFGMRAVVGYESALEVPGLDVVHICAPNNLHYPIAHAALRAGKHVLCEKPLALNPVEGAVLASLAASTGRVAVVCHNYRFHPLVAELRARIAEGDLGRLHAIRGSFLQDWLLLATDDDWRVDALRGGVSRAIADIGSHWLDLAEVTSGLAVEAVAAQVGTIHRRRGLAEGAPRDVATEDQAGLLLRFSDGLQGTLVVSQAAAGHPNEMELSLDGSRASATWRRERPDELWIGRRDAESALVRRSEVRAPAARELAAGTPDDNEGRRNLIAGTYAVIAHERAAEDLPMPLPTFESGAHQLAVAAAALESSVRGVWVRVADVVAQLPGQRIRAGHQ